MNRSSVSEISRRRFLARASLGLAAVSTLSRAVAQGSSANSRLRLGLVGCGSRGQWILNLFAEHGGYEVAAIADYFEAQVRPPAEKFKLSPAQTFTGLQCAQKMIAHGGLDAVAIMGRTAAQEKRTVEWTDFVKTKNSLQADLSGLQA